MIGSIKTRPLKNDPDRRVNLTQCFLRTFRAARQQRVAVFLVLIEPHTAIFTLVCINGHNLPFRTAKEDYNALNTGWQDKG
jgi:hypothetical protein